MTENMQENDPFNEMMDEAKGDIRPDFLSATDKNKKNEEKKGRAKDAASGLGANEKAAANKPFGKKGGSEGDAVKDGAGAAPGLGGIKGFFSGKGKKKGGLLKGGKGKLGVGKLSAGAFLIFGLGGALVGIGAVGTPLLMIGALDFNLQRALGYDYTSAVLEKQAEYVTGEMLSNGEVPDGYASDLAAAGMTVGQVTAKGDFVRTNVYVADADKLNELAAVGTGFQTVGSEGELAVLFDDQVTSAEDFVLAVESNPKMYAAYSKAANVKSRYFYSDDVNSVYQNLGISRDSFSDWVSVGDPKLDLESAKSFLVQALDKNSETSLAGCGEGDCNETVGVSGANADEVVSSAGVSAGGTKNAAQLLNAAISAEEPYKAASAFVAIEEPIQRTRIDGDGPGNEILQIISEPHIVTYIDVNTGKKVERVASVLETQNFAAAVSWEKFSKSEANNFAKDRIIYVTGTKDDDLLKKTTVNGEANRKSDIAGASASDSVDDEVLSKAVDSVAIGATEKNSDLFQSVVGGNRAIQGGAALLSFINGSVLGSVSSDAKANAEYNHEAKEVLARKAEADRATLSPFDISSPNTFLGSIVHGFAMSMLKSRSSFNVASLTRATTDLASRSVSGALGEAKAEGGSDDYMSTYGEICSTVNSTGTEADIYCTEKKTNYLGYMSKGEKFWKEKLKGDIYDDYANNYVKGPMIRGSTIGTKDASVCKAYKEENSTFADDIGDAISALFGVYTECRGVDDEIATGAKYVLSGDNNEAKLYSAYTLYDTTKSLLSGTESTSSRILKEYYAKHPIDNSPAGIISRRSGMTKEEAQIALNYASYLSEIARYDASDRYVFGATLEAPKQDVLVSYANQFNETIYCFWREKTNYGDVRNQVYLV